MKSYKLPTFLFAMGLILMGMGTLMWNTSHAATPPICMSVNDSNELLVCSNDAVPVGVDIYLDGHYFDTVTNVPHTGVQVGLPVAWCTAYAAAWDMPTNDGHSSMSVVVINPNPVSGSDCPSPVPVVTVPVTTEEGICIDSTAYVAGTDPLEVLSQTTHCF